MDPVLPNALATIVEYPLCCCTIPGALGNTPCLHACKHPLNHRSWDEDTVQRMQSRLACIDCCPACCHRNHSCSGPAIAFTDGRAARSHRSTGNLSWSIHPRDNDFINVDSAMLAKCPALRSCRPAVSSDGVINVMPTSHPHRLSAQRSSSLHLLTHICKTDR